MGLTVLYDAHCRLCTRIAGRLAAMDRRDRLRFVPLQMAAHDRPDDGGAREPSEEPQRWHLIPHPHHRLAAGGPAAVLVDDMERGSQVA